MPFWFMKKRELWRFLGSSENVEILFGVESGDAENSTGPVLGEWDGGQKLVADGTLKDARGDHF